MKILLTLLIIFFPIYCLAQPSNDDCSSSKVISSVDNYCSADKEFSTINAGNNDVWFQFTARAFDVNISVTGNTDGSGNTGGTLTAPVIQLNSDCGLTYPSSIISSDNVTSLYKGGLIIGKVYFIRVSGANTGTFKLCINNYNPIVKPGQDCSTASYLCSKESFTQTDVTGAGLNNNEAAGTCLGIPGLASEQNTAWYKWTAATSGTLTFVITPTANDDIDWVLYDLGITDNCAAVNSGYAIRCNAARGVDCLAPGQKRFTKTGLDMNSTDLSENGGCLEGQDGFVKYVDMIEGHVYALLINNFDRGNNGFTIEFGGTGEFLGPKVSINFRQNKACTPEQDFTFTSLGKNFNRLKWTFGEGANIDSADTEGPVAVRYSTSGIKTVVLQAFGDKGCSVVVPFTFSVAQQPEPPVISVNNTSFCLNEALILSTPAREGAAYSWTGPNGFVSNQQTVDMQLSDYNLAGVYSLTITVNGCTSNSSVITIPTIKQAPVLNIEVKENNPCTSQLSYTITNLASNYLELKSDFGRGAKIIEGTGIGPFTVTYNSPGTRTITVLASSLSGCTTIAESIIDVPAIAEKPIIEFNQGRFCLNDTIKLNTPQLTDVRYLWVGPNNFRSDQSSISIPVTDYNLAGTYTLVASIGRCSSEAAEFIVPEIVKNPIAAFSSDPRMPAKLAAPFQVRFINYSSNADTYLWDFGDGTTSIEENPGHAYTAVGEYNVTLTAFKRQACRSSSIKQGTFIIKADTNIFIPNTFTPNGDQVNDEFVVTITNLKQYGLQIFNRFGTRLFKANDIFDNWKGTFNNQPLPTGTYYYIIDAVDLNEEPIKRSGSITLIR